MIANTSQPKDSAFKRLRRRISSKKKQKGSVTSDAAESGRYSSSSIGDLEKVFNYFDENRDGRISAAELRRCLNLMGEQLTMEDAEAAVSSSDLNGDGHLDFEEFQKLMEESFDNEERNKELRDAFGMYVMEGTSNITPASLRRTLSRLGDFRSVDDCKAMIRPFDLNGDGVLSFDEFAVMMH